MQTKTTIQPVGAGTGIATQFQLVAAITDLASQTANLTYILYDSGNATVGLGRWFMDSETYAQWGASDEYAMTATLSGVGLVQA